MACASCCETLRTRRAPFHGAEHQYYECVFTDAMHSRSDDQGICDFCRDLQKSRLKALGMTLTATNHRANWKR